MKLYFLRHAEAEEKNDMTDHDRRLTPEGIEHLKAAASIMANLRIAPLYIFSGPRLRARQTANLVAEALGLAVDVREEVDFTFDVEAVELLIHNFHEDDDVMFVGHNPSISAVVRALTGADVSLRPGGLARVDLYDESELLKGELVWLISPDVFDTLTRS